MKSFTEYLTFNIPSRMGFVNITPQVEEAVRNSGVKEGIVLCNAMHITASVFINDDEPGLHQDYKDWQEKLAPFDPSPRRYRHNRARGAAKTTGTPTTSGRSWAERSSWRSPIASSTSAPGSKSSTVSSTVVAGRGC